MSEHADYERDPLLNAARYRNYAMVVRLLDDGADPNVCTGGGITPLHRVACDGHAEATKALLAAGADPCALSDGGKAPLHYAAGNGHAEVVEVLLAAGADPDAGQDDDDGGCMTPLHLAVSGLHQKNTAAHAHVSDFDCEAAVAALIAGGADVNARCRNWALERDMQALRAAH